MPTCFLSYVVSNRTAEDRAVRLRTDPAATGHMAARGRPYQYACRAHTLCTGSDAAAAPSAVAHPAPAPRSPLAGSIRGSRFATAPRRASATPTPDCTGARRGMCWIGLANLALDYGEFVPSPAVEQPTRALLEYTTPLFKEEWNFD